MTHPSIHQTELAAALFDLVGGPVPHPYEQEEEARALSKQLGDRSKVLLKVIELCKTPTTPEQLYLTARAYSFLGGPYAEETERYATAYLSTDGWKGLPQRTVEEEGILINQAAANRACIVSDLAAAEEHLGKYRLEPSQAMYAIKAADGMTQRGRKEEALAFLRQQKKSRYYTPVDRPGRWGAAGRNATFQELLNAHILKLEAK